MNDVYVDLCVIKCEADDDGQWGDITLKYVPREDEWDYEITQDEDRVVIAESDIDEFIHRLRTLRQISGNSQFPDK